MIIIHCGLHKTGSTAIQTALTNVPRRQIPWVSVPVDGSDRSYAGQAERLKRTFQHPNIVISDENILGSPFNGYLEAPERVGLLYNSLGRREAKVIVYFRPHLRWLESLYLQAIQQGDSANPEDFWTRLSDSPWLQWNRLLDLLEDCPINCKVIPRVYTPEPSTVQDFFQTLGLGALPQLVPRNLRANTSISPLHASLLQGLLQRPDVSAGDKTRIRAFFQTLPATASSMYSVFPDGLRLAMQTHFADDWLTLMNRLGQDHPPTDPAQPNEDRTSSAPVALHRGFDDPLVQAEVLKLLGEFITGKLSATSRPPRDPHARQLIRGLRRRLMVKPRIVS